MNKMFFAALLSLIGVTAMAEKQLNTKNITKEFSTETLTGINPIEGTDRYARIEGDKIVEYSFSTGKQTRVLFDVTSTIGETITGFDGYIMSPCGTKMLIQTETEKVYRRSFKAKYYIYTIKSKRLEVLSEGGKQQIPQFSKDGNQIAFVRDNNLWLVKLLYDNAESQVTKDGEWNKIINGAPDWVNEEEFGMSSSFCFNADGTKLCWIKYDESKVREYGLQMFKGLAPEKMEYDMYPGLYSYKYPKAGEDNAVVSAWSYDIKSHRPQRLQIPEQSGYYMPRIKATDNPDRIIVMTMNRHQDELNIFAVNPSSTVSTLILKEKSKCYIPESVFDNMRFGQQSFLIPSDRSGYTHLYIYGMNGQLMRQVTQGQYDVTAVYGYDETLGDVYYQAAVDSPLERQVMVTHKNGRTDRLTQKSGWNDALFAPNLSCFINTWSNMNTPYQITLCNKLGKVVSTIIDNKKLQASLNENNWNRREKIQLTTADGVQLNGWMVKPQNFSAQKQYPVVMHQYSGPGSQQVKDSWSVGSMGQGFDYMLAQNGFIVVCVDGRGTGARGADFEKCIYRRMGQLEAHDQVEVAKWLAKQSYVDKEHISIWGWSFGGFNTLMSMSEGSDVFCCGVAIAPPTDWRFYDSIYTERYMRTPQENSEGYKDNPITRADKMHGALLLVHGLADDNVHPQNMFEYTEALVQADKDFKELIYTNRNHSIYGANTRNHLYRQVLNWFLTNGK